MLARELASPPFFVRELRMLISRTSLSRTVDAINAAQFEGRALAATERRHVSRWIAARQGLSGSSGGTFAGFPSERSKGVVLFTGERIASASARHILGEEAYRCADGEHGWRNFPFWYTVLALSEMNIDEAKAELKYAAPALEHTASRPAGSTVYARRRLALAAR